MLRLDLGLDELAATRFACSALHETVASIRVLNDPAAHTMLLPWYREAVPRVAGLDLALLRALVPTRPRPAYAPDFISPPPGGPFPDLDDDLRRVAATPAQRVAAEVAETFGDEPPPPVVQELLDDPRRGLARLTGQLRAYFDAALAPRWPSIRALLEADIAHRARRLSDGGARALFEQLHPAVRWADGGLTLSIAYEATLRLDERGLLLVPSVFTWPEVYAVTDAPWQPALIYPARGAATAWEPGGPPPPDALARLLGATRAALLDALDVPRTGSSLAAAAGVSAGAVSQHVAVLRDAGLVVTHRDGRYVIVARTALGDRLTAGGVG